MFLVPTYVAPSGIHGLGVFAARPIAAGTVIWRMHPAFDAILEPDVVASLPEEGRRFTDVYCYESPIAPGCLILNGDNARYLNHSETPNTDNADPLVARASRDIAAGEEITCDYRECCVGFDVGEFGGAGMIADCVVGTVTLSPDAP